MSRIVFVFRRPSPGPREAAWDRHDVIGEPQGIPVIGGVKPQPIPSLANRGDQSMGEYEHMGRMPPSNDECKIQPPIFGESQTSNKPC